MRTLSLVGFVLLTTLVGCEKSRGPGVERGTAEREAVQPVESVAKRGVEKQTAAAAEDTPPPPKPAGEGEPTPADAKAEPAGEENPYAGKISARELSLAELYAPLLESPVEGGPKAQVDGMKAAARLLHDRWKATRFKVTLTPEGTKGLLKLVARLHSLNQRVDEYTELSGAISRGVPLVQKAYERVAEEGVAIPDEARALLGEFAGDGKEEAFFAAGTFNYNSHRLKDALDLVRTKAALGGLSAGELFDAVEGVAACGVHVRRARDVDRKVHRLVELIPPPQRLSALEEAFWKGTEVGRDHETAVELLLASKNDLLQGGGQEQVGRKLPDFRMKIQSEFARLEKRKRDALARVFHRPDAEAFRLLHELNDALSELNRVLAAAVPEFGHRFKPVLPKDTPREQEGQVIPPLELPEVGDDDLPQVTVGWGDLESQTEIVIRRPSKRTVSEKALSTWDGCLHVMAGATLPSRKGRHYRDEDFPSLDDARRADAEAAFERARRLPPPTDPELLDRAKRVIAAYLLARLDATERKNWLYLRVLESKTPAEDGRRTGHLVQDVACDVAVWVHQSEQGHRDTLQRYAAPERETAWSVAVYAGHVLAAAEAEKRHLTDDEASRLAGAVTFLSHAAQAGEKMIDLAEKLYATAHRVNARFPDTAAGRGLRAAFNRTLAHWNETSRFNPYLNEVNPLPAPTAAKGK